MSEVECVGIRIENPTGRPLWVNGVEIPPFTWIDSEGCHGRTVIESAPPPPHKETEG